MIDTISLLHRYHDAQNAFDMSAVENMFAPDATYATPAFGATLVGRDKIMAMMRKHFAEFSDQVSRDEKIEKIDELTVLSNWSLNATSAFSGQKLIRSGTETIHFNSDGLIQSVEVKDLD